MKTSGLTITVLFLITAAVLTVGWPRKNRVSRRRMTRLMRSNIEKNTWSRDVGGVNMTEAAAVLRSKERIFFKSADRDLPSQNVSRSVTYMDFNCDVMVVRAMAVGLRRCILVPRDTSQNFTTVADDLLNRQVVPDMNDEVEFTMTADMAMDRWARRSFKKRCWYLERKCKRFPIMRATESVTNTTDLIDRESVTVLGVGGRITIYLSTTV